MEEINMNRKNFLASAMVVCMSLVIGCSSNSKDTVKSSSAQSSSSSSTTSSKPSTSTGSSSSSSKSSSSSSSSSSKSNSSETYWCMGKGDTCQNKTYSPIDFYCNSCDPDNDNREG